MQHSLTTATPFKSQKILFKARALGSNVHPPQLHDLLHFSPVLPPVMGYPPPPDTRISSICLLANKNHVA